MVRAAGPEAAPEAVGALSALGPGSLESSLALLKPNAARSRRPLVPGIAAQSAVKQVVSPSLPPLLQAAAAVAARDGGGRPGSEGHQQPLPLPQLPPHKAAAARIEEALGVGACCRGLTSSRCMPSTQCPSRVPASILPTAPLVPPALSCLPQQPDLLRLESCQLGDFDVGRVLGTGSFGRVSLARHKASGLVCAIKALSKAHIVKSQQVRQAARLGNEGLETEGGCSGHCD